jgi:hypothetical protein
MSIEPKFKVGDIIRWNTIINGTEMHMLITHMEYETSPLRLLMYCGIHLETGNELFQSTAGHIERIAKAQKVA